jgi:hypothetical protein
VPLPVAQRHLRLPYVAHAALEVMNAVVTSDSTADLVPSQTPNYQAGQIATALAFRRNVTMHPVRGRVWPALFGESAIEAALSRRRRRPTLMDAQRRHAPRRFHRGPPQPARHLAGGTMLTYDTALPREMDLRRHGTASAPARKAHAAIEQVASMPRSRSVRVRVTTRLYNPAGV